MNKQSAFEKTDAYFDGKKKNEIYIMVLMFMLIIGFLIWYTAFPVSQSFFNNQKAENQKITSVLSKEADYLSSKTVKGDENYYIKKLSRDIRKNKQKLVSIKKLNSYIDNKLKELSYLLFNNKNWARFLDSISEIARKNNVKVMKITNHINEPNFKKVEQILNVHVTLNGSYHGIINFINTLEESMLIVDVYNIELNRKKDIEGMIDIAIWGIKY